MAKIDIIMPVYNVENYIQKSIESVLKQTVSDFRLIIVDDKSTDNSLTIINEIAAKDNRIEVISLEKNTPGGAGAPSNIALNSVNAPYVTFIDSDDLYYDDFLESNLRNIENSGAEISISRFEILDDITKELSPSYDQHVFSKLYKEYGNSPIIGEEKLKLTQISPVPWAKMYKSSFFTKKNMRFPEGNFFFEDSPLHWDVCKNSEGVSLLDKILVKHRKERKGQTTSKSDNNATYILEISKIISNKLHTQEEKKFFLNWFYDRYKWIQPHSTNNIISDLDSFIKDLDWLSIDIIKEAESINLINDLSKAYYTNLINQTPTNKTLITVVVPIYNKEKYITECINSLKNQSLREIEVICIDDASSDTSAEKLALAINNDDRFLTIKNNKNLGVAKTRNKGIKKANGKYLFFLDADDTITPDGLEHLYHLSEKNKADVALLGFNAFSDKSKDKERCQHYNNYYNKHLHLFIENPKEITLKQVIRESLIPVSPCKLYLTSFLKKNKIRFINKKIIHEDEGWFIKWISNNPTICATQKKVYNRRVVTDSIMSTYNSTDQESKRKHKKNRKISTRDALIYLLLKNYKNYKIVLLNLPALQFIPKIFKKHRNYLSNRQSR